MNLADIILIGQVTSLSLFFRELNFFIKKLKKLKNLIFLKKNAVINTVRLNDYELNDQLLDEKSLQDLRRLRHLDIILWSILKEALVYMIFLVILYTVSIFNLNSSSYTYNQLFYNTFVYSNNPKELGLSDVMK